MVFWKNCNLTDHLFSYINHGYTIVGAHIAFGKYASVNWGSKKCPIATATPLTLDTIRKVFSAASNDDVVKEQQENDHAANSRA